jgi:signal peptidase I
LAIAILLVLLVRQMGVEAFRIHHGSMAPTLLGAHLELRCPNCHHVFEVGEDKTGSGGAVECDNCHFLWRDMAELRYEGLDLPEQTEIENRVHRGAARVFVNKFIYHVRDPRRWDVVVFRVDDLEAGKMKTASDHLEPGIRLNEQAPPKNYIKRVVGLPGEQVALADGDVYVDGRIARKTPDVQSDLWMHVYDSSYPPQKSFNRGPIWVPGDRPELWEIPRDGGRAVVNAIGASGPALMQFGRKILDYYAYDGPLTMGKSGNNVVGDCRVQARVRPIQLGAAGAVLLGLSDAGHDFTLRVGFGKGAETALLMDGEVVKTVSGALEPAAPGVVSLENYDDRIVARLNDEALLRYDYEPDGSPLENPYVFRRWDHRVRFGAEDAHVEFARVRIHRDMYWVRPTGADIPNRYQLADDEYFVLGDNSPQSSDSRSASWYRPGVSSSHLVGQTFLVFWPVHRIGVLQGGDAQ